jgi:hypothetical protein
MATYNDYQQAFYDRVWEPIKRVAAQIGVDARIIFAQAALESNWGRSGLSRNANNFFGIKARSGEPSIGMRTREFINGAWTTITAQFRRYSNVLEGIEGYGQFIQRNPRYRSFIGASGLDAELAALQASGYATDPNYASKLKSIIRNMPEGGDVANFSNGSPQVGPDPFREFLSDVFNSPTNPFGRWGLGGVVTGAGRVISNETQSVVEGATNVVEGATNFVASGGGILDWLREFFSVNTAARVISVVVGISFVVVAIIVLMNSDVRGTVATTSPA